MAASSGCVEIMEELLKRGSHPEEWDLNQKCTPLHCAAAAGDVMAVKLLLKAGANVDAGLKGKGGELVKTPLHYAVLNDASNCVQALLEAGASPNILLVIFNSKGFKISFFLKMIDLLRPGLHGNTFARRCKLGVGTLRQASVGPRRRRQSTIRQCKINALASGCRRR